MLKKTFGFTVTANNLYKPFNQWEILADGFSQVFETSIQIKYYNSSYSGMQKIKNNNYIDYIVFYLSYALSCMYLYYRCMRCCYS